MSFSSGGGLSEPFKGDRTPPPLDPPMKGHKFIIFNCYTSHILQLRKMLSWTLISVNRHICKSCQREVSRSLVTSAEMDVLSQQVHDNIVVTDNVYKTTTPAELNKFVKFVKQHGPFSCVIDGLNTGYLLGRQGHFANFKSEAWNQVRAKYSMFYLACAHI